MVGYAENELEADPDLWRRLMHPEDLKRAGGDSQRSDDRGNIL